MAQGAKESGPAEKGEKKDVTINGKTSHVNGVDPTKPIADGKKKDGEKQEEELNEEDQQLKSDLEMMVERLQESDTSLYETTLQHIRDAIKTSTTSMTSVPKPLKFLGPHYKTMVEVYEKWISETDKAQLADILSVLGMIHSDEEHLECLKYRLLTKGHDSGFWGHEYVRHLALEVGQDYQKRAMEDRNVDQLLDLARETVPFFLSHNAEADAVDLLSEVELVDEMPKFVDENTYQRVCLYMVSMVQLLMYPEDQEFLRTAHEIYKKYGKVAQAMTLAIRLNDLDMIKADFESVKDKSLKRQLAFMLARQQIWLEPDEADDDPELTSCLFNTPLHEHFKALAKSLNLEDPKSVDDVYKSHLESNRVQVQTNIDSARQNLASAFVNAFTNAGFQKDKLLLGDNGWIYKTKDEGQMSTAASIGMLLKWDLEGGALDKINVYAESKDHFIKAGAMLAYGILNSGVRSEGDEAKALLEEELESPSVHVRVAAIMGLGIAFAGSNREDLLEPLTNIVQDTSQTMQVSAMAALSLGLIFVGSLNGEITQSIIETLHEREEKQLRDKWTRFMALGVAFLCFGAQEEAEPVQEAVRVVGETLSKPILVLIDICAWAGTGTVLKLQELLHHCNDHYESPSDAEMGDSLMQTYAVLGLALVGMGEDVGQEMVLRQFGHLMHYGEANIRKVVPLAMGLLSPSNPQMKIYDTLSRYSHDTDNDVAVNAIFAMGLVGAGTNNARLAQLLRQLASYYHRDQSTLFMVRLAQALLHMGKGTMTLSPFHSDRQVISRVSAAGLLTVLVSLVDAKQFILADAHYLVYYLAPAMYPRMLITVDEDLKPKSVNVRVGQAVDIVGQAGRPKTITGWQTQSTPVLLGYGDRAELEDDEWIALNPVLEGAVIIKKNPDWEGNDK